MLSMYTSIYYSTYYKYNSKKILYNGIIYRILSIDIYTYKLQVVKIFAAREEDFVLLHYILRAHAFLALGCRLLAKCI